MNITTRYSLLSCLLLGALFAPTAHATVKGRLTLSSTFYTYGDGYWEGDVFRGTIGRARFGTKELLNLLEDLSGFQFPPRSTIEGYPDGSVYVIYNGEILADVSSVMSFDLGSGDDSLFSGTYDDVTYRERSRIMFPVKVSFHHGPSGTNFEMTGIAFESFSATPRAVDMISASGSIRSKVSGAGEIFGQYWLAEGKFALKGRATVPLQEYLGE